MAGKRLHPGIKSRIIAAEKHPIRAIISFMLNGLPIKPVAENAKLPAAILNNSRLADRTGTVRIVSVSCGKDIQFQSVELEIEGRLNRVRR